MRAWLSAKHLHADCDLGDLNQGERLYNRAMEMHPEHVETLFNMAAFQQIHKKDSKTVRCFDVCVFMYMCVCMYVCIIYTGRVYNLDDAYIIHTDIHQRV
jgi:hypothetical protein